MKNWYIVQSHSNFENKVAKLIKEEAEKLIDMDDVIKLALNRSEQNGIIFLDEIDLPWILDTSDDIIV